MLAINAVIVPRATATAATYMIAAVKARDIDPVEKGGERGALDGRKGRGAGGFRRLD